MERATVFHWELLERWSPTLFLVGGSLLVGHTAMLGVQAFSNLTTPPDVFGPTGHLVALVGLLGLYPTLADRTPTVMRVAGAVAAVALVSWAVMSLTRFLAVGGIVSSVSEALPGIFPIIVFASTILTYLLFGVATVRTDDSSRTVGLLVLAPGVLVLVALVSSAVAGVTALGGVLIGGGLALSVLALGYTLRTWRSHDHAVPAADATAG